jgi:hypothetical protein
MPIVDFLGQPRSPEDEPKQNTRGHLVVPANALADKIVAAIAGAEYEIARSALLTAQYRLQQETGRG